MHNACSYGHFLVAELLVKNGTNVNSCDLWKFTSLHEAALKGKLEIVKLLLKHGADPNRKNRELRTPLDMVLDKFVLDENDQEIADLLRGDEAILDAAKKGELSRLMKLVTKENVDCRDCNGRNSTPLHLASGYNNFQVAEFLLEMGANVNSIDKGGLIPLHNASSYGHLDLAALLIKHGANVNAPDRWGFTPLHEAAQKGRTQLVALLLSHGASVKLKNYEGYIPLDLVTEDHQDVKCLLMDAQAEPAIYSVAVNQITNLLTMADASKQQQTQSSEADQPTKSQAPAPMNINNPIMLQLVDMMNTITTSGGDKATDISQQQQQQQHKQRPINVPSSLALMLTQRNANYVNGDNGDGHVAGSSVVAHNTFAPVSSNNQNTMQPSTVPAFLTSLGLDFLIETLMREHITLDILAEMDHEGLKQIGVTAYGHRHKILKGIEKWIVSSSLTKFTATQPGGNLLTAGEGIVSSPAFNTAKTFMLQLSPEDQEYKTVEDEMQLTIREHKDGGQAGGVFSRYHIVKIQKLFNLKLWQRYLNRRQEICEENYGVANERMLFHGSAFINSIIQKGFDERHAHIGGMFGAGIYFAEHSSKSNQYVFGINGGKGCPAHNEKGCYTCPRQILLCRTALGRCFYQFSPLKIGHAPPGHHAVLGRPSCNGLGHNGLTYPEYVIYRGEQSYPGEFEHDIGLRYF